MMLRLPTKITIFIIAILFSGELFSQSKFAEGYEAAQSGNYSKAVKIWTPLAEQGDTSAQYTLAWMYESGQGVKQNDKMAAHWYQKAAHQGNSAAQYVLGSMYAKGKGVAEDQSKALSFYKLAANQGDAIAQFQVGNYFQHGIGTEKDDKVSIFWYQKAAQQGHITAQINLGNMYQAGKGVEQDYKKAIQWYENAANQNNALAQYQLAHMYEYGWGEKQNLDKAILLYTKSAKNNYSQAAYKLGMIYESGQGTPIDYEQAATWYRQAALQGNANAQFQLGYLSELGNGTPKNIQRAMEWYIEASRRDHAQAHYQLAYLYEYGTTQYTNNISKNMQKAFKYYQSASLLNYHLAHAKLAYFHENGIQTEVDTTQAITLYKQASQPWAKLRLDRLVAHQECLDTSSTQLFSVLIKCANRTLLRTRIEQQSIKKISEDDRSWSDTYFTGAVIKGSSELTVHYTREDLFAQASYTFVGRNNPALITRIKEALFQRFGEPTSFKGNESSGEASFQWILPDSIVLNVYRHWPDTTTFVEYTHQAHLDLQKEQQKESLNKLYQSKEQRAREPDAPTSATLF